jgi:hypothetical protein
MSPLSNRVWQVGQRAIRFSNACVLHRDQGWMWDISSGTWRQVGMAHRCPHSINIARSISAGIGGRFAIEPFPIQPSEREAMENDTAPTRRTEALARSAATRSARLALVLGSRLSEPPLLLPALPFSSPFSTIPSADPSTCTPVTATQCVPCGLARPLLLSIASLRTVIRLHPPRGIRAWI